MSISATVDAGYRIQAADLAGQEWEWVISNVSYQGVEEMSPVLHLRGLTKRLVLDAEQSRQMMALARTPLPEEWIGATIRVAPRQTTDNGTIMIKAAHLPKRDVRWWDAGRWATWLVVLLLLFLAASVAWALAPQLLQP